MTMMSRTKALMMRYMPTMVTCREANEFIDDYLSGELPVKQRRVFERHMKMCKPCRDYLDRYKHSIDLCRDNFYDKDGENGQPLPEEIIKGIIDAKRESER